MFKMQSFLLPLEYIFYMNIAVINGLLLGARIFVRVGTYSIDWNKTLIISYLPKKIHKRKIIQTKYKIF